jgi:hypothetical protein
MENKYLIGAGVIALGLFAYSRYAKKDESGQGEEQGGGGGGGFMPNYPTPQIPLTPPTPPTPPTRPANQGRSYNAEQVTKSRDTTPTAAVTSSTQAKAIEKATNTGGIVPISQGGSVTPTRQTGSVIQISQADLNKGISGGMVFKPFSGSESNGKTPIYLNDLVRSWNRP